MSRAQVRRAVDMANDRRRRSCGRHRRPHHRHGRLDCRLRRRSSPFARAPWHWGCNGNHEIYARVEDEAADLFAQAGMKLCATRTRNYFQKARSSISSAWTISASALPAAKDNKTLAGVEPLVRRDMPNISFRTIRTASIVPRSLHRAFSRRPHPRRPDPSGNPSTIASAPRASSPIISPASTSARFSRQPSTSALPRPVTSRR